MAIYLHYEGIKGNVTASGYEKHIAVDSVKFGVNRGISMDVGKLANREISQPVITEVVLGKVIDSSVTMLFKEAVAGSSGKQAVIKFVRTDTDKVQKYMEYTLENCLVSGYMITAKGDGEPTETIALSFSEVVVNYIDHDSTNKAGSPQRAGYDLATAKLL